MVAMRWAGLLLLLVAGCGGGGGAVAAAQLPFEFNVGGGTRIVVAGVPVLEREALSQAIPGRPGHHAPSITAFPDGELLATWYSYEGPYELDGSAIYMARRPAGGTWTAPWLHIDRPAGEGNPVLYSEGDSVWFFQSVLFLGWSGGRIDTQRSADRGRTWTAPETIPVQLGANSRSPPVRLPNGTLLLPAYNELPQHCLFFYSEGGDSWTKRGELWAPGGGNAIQPSLALVRGNRLLAIMRNSIDDWLWVAASDDDGRSWTSPVNAGFTSWDTAPALARLASNNLVLVYVPGATGRGPLHIALSADDGRTWPEERVLTEGRWDSYPSVVQAPDGRIHVVFSVSKLGIDHVTTNEAWIAAGP